MYISMSKIGLMRDFRVKAEFYIDFECFWSEQGEKFRIEFFETQQPLFWGKIAFLEIYFSKITFSLL